MKGRNSYLQNISKEQIDLLPTRHFEGPILLIDSEETLAACLPSLEKAATLGFDTETKPSFKKGRRNKVALLQLSTDDVAFIIRINKIGLPLELTRILQAPGITKVGIAIKDDIQALQKIRKFNPGGFIELQSYVKQYDIQDNGLKKLTANILNFRISKSQQTSNWESDELTEQQQIYAATDAWVCFKIYQELLKNG